LEGGGLRHAYDAANEGIADIPAHQLLLGHTRLENTVRYLGIEVDDAREMAEKPDV
jgi:integrase